MFRRGRLVPGPGPDTQTSRKSRRTFLRLAGLTVAGGALAACAPSPGATPARPVSGDLAGVSDEGFIGSLDEFSPKVINYGLRPREFSPEVSGEERVKAAISYLDRLRKALRDNPSINMLLSDYRITGNEAMFPIALTDDSRISTVLDTFFEYDDKTQVIYNPDEINPQVYAGTSTPSFVYLDGSWQREGTVIGFTSLIVRPANYFERNGKYDQMTDLDIALLLVYEYPHVLREDTILTWMQTDGKLPPAPTSEEEKHTFSGKVRAALNDENDSLINQKRTYYRVPDRYANGAQSNALQCLTLFALELLNFEAGDNGFYMPGARLLDPSPDYIPPADNLYRNFHKYLYKPGGATLLDVGAWVNVAGLSP